jgi:TRAP-type mannitol/chloroaromatic compound transport system permease small subunit
MLRLADLLDAINERIGRAVAWLLLALALMQFAIVVMRYVFGAGSLWMQESIFYLHASVFMLAAGYTVLHDGHVRVSIYYDRFSPHWKAAADLLGAVTLLLPFAAIVLFQSIPYVQRSWAILEGSRESSGLPAVFLLKTLIPLYAALLALAGISSIIRTVAALRAPSPRPAA